MIAEPDVVLGGSATSDTGAAGDAGDADVAGAGLATQRVEDASPPASVVHDWIGCGAGMEGWIGCGAEGEGWIGCGAEGEGWIGCGAEGEGDVMSC